MSNILKNLIFFAAGFLVARYLILRAGSETYKAQEAKATEGIVAVKNNVRAWLISMFPQLSEIEVEEAVNDALNGSNQNPILNDDQDDNIDYAAMQEPAIYEPLPPIMDNGDSDILAYNQFIAGKPGYFHRGRPTPGALYTDPATGMQVGYQVADAYELRNASGNVMDNNDFFRIRR